MEAHVSMQNITETALLGAYHPLHNEIGALAAAVANPENHGIKTKDLWIVVDLRDVIY